MELLRFCFDFSFASALTSASLRPRRIPDDIIVGGWNSTQHLSSVGRGSRSYFHMCSGGLLPDIMHDLLEGALQYETKLMLQQFILREKYITLDAFNNRLERFELGYMEEKDRPSPISDTTLRSESSNTLKQADMSNMHGYWSLGQGWYMYIRVSYSGGSSPLPPPPPPRQKFFNSQYFNF